MSDIPPADEAVLNALHPIAQELEVEQYLGDDTVIVTKAVVAYEYIDSDGETQWGYRRINAGWMDVAGAAKLLELQIMRAWAEE